MSYRRPPAIADVLDRAAQLIADRGWSHGGYARGQRRLDATNAIRLAVEDLNGGDQIIAVCLTAIDVMSDGVDPRLRRRGYGLSRWNDRADQTADNVIAELRRVARAERRKAAVGYQAPDHGATGLSTSRSASGTPSQATDRPSDNGAHDAWQQLQLPTQP